MDKIEAQNWLYRPTFSKDWNRAPLYSLAAWVNGLAFRDFVFSESGKPIIKIAEIKDGISSQTKFTDQKFDESAHIYSGDLLFSWSGQPETSIDAFWWRGSEGWLNQHTFRVTSKDSINQQFLYYLLKYLKPSFIGIARNKQTTGLGHVTKRDLQEIEAAYPSKSEQLSIVSILGSLDDKIELNHQMNETLEQTARALFKSWFVDFDPVRAKAEGRDTGLPKEIADLFPDSFVDSELKEIPKGWGVGKLSDITKNLRRGVQPEQIDPSTPYIGLEHMPRHCIALSDWDHASELGSNKLEFKRGEILFGKLRPYFHKVGVAPVDGVCSTDILVIAPTDKEWFGFALGHLSSEDLVNYTSAGSTGTKMPRTGWGEMARYPIVLPPTSIASIFTSFVDPSMEKIIANIHESKTLSEIRDLLLPKILSGEIHVS